MSDVLCPIDESDTGVSDTGVSDVLCQIPSVRSVCQIGVLDWCVSSERHVGVSRRCVTSVFQIWLMLTPAGDRLGVDRSPPRLESRAVFEPRRCAANTSISSRICVRSMWDDCETDQNQKKEWVLCVQR